MFTKAISAAGGLQFGGLKEKILHDSLYQEAFAAVRDLTIQSEDNRMNIFLLLQFFLERLPFGHIFEYGSYRGNAS